MPAFTALSLPAIYLGEENLTLFSLAFYGNLQIALERMLSKFTVDG